MISFGFNVNGLGSLVVPVGVLVDFGHRGYILDSVDPPVPPDAHVSTSKEVFSTIIQFSPWGREGCLQTLLWFKQPRDAERSTCGFVGRGPNSRLLRLCFCLGVAFRDVDSGGSEGRRSALGLRVVVGSCFLEVGVGLDSGCKILMLEWQRPRSLLFDLVVSVSGMVLEDHLLGLGGRRSSHIKGLGSIFSAGPRAERVRPRLLLGLQVTLDSKFSIVVLGLPSFGRQGPLRGEPPS